MTALELMRQYALRENEACRPFWDDVREGNQNTNAVRDRIKPYLGSGMTHRELAEQLGVTRAAVSNALRQQGWTL